MRRGLLLFHAPHPFPVPALAFLHLLSGNPPSLPQSSFQAPAPAAPGPPPRQGGGAVTPVIFSQSRILQETPVQGKPPPRLQELRAESDRLKAALPGPRARQRRALRLPDRPFAPGPLTPIQQLLPSAPSPGPALPALPTVRRGPRATPRSHPTLGSVPCRSAASHFQGRFGGRGRTPQCLPGLAGPSIVAGGCLLGQKLRAQ